MGFFLFVYACIPAGSLVAGISNLFANLVNRQQFLDPGESVLMISMVKKLQKLTSKKVQLILTNKPKLIYVDPSKLIVKGNIIWSDNPNDLSIQVTSPTHFKICTVCPPCSLLSALLSSRAYFLFTQSPSTLPKLQNKLKRKTRRRISKALASKNFGVGYVSSID